MTKLSDIVFSGFAVPLQNISAQLNAEFLANAGLSPLNSVYSFGFEDPEISTTTFVNLSQARSFVLFAEDVVDLDIDLQPVSTSVVSFSLILGGELNSLSINSSMPGFGWLQGESPELELDNPSAARYLTFKNIAGVWIGDGGIIVPT